MYKTVRINDIELAYRTSKSFGAGSTHKTVLLLHGNSMSSRSFQQQLEGDLGRRIPIIALDLPGHGDSGWAAEPEEIYTIRGYTKILLGFVEALGFEDSVFVGWSLGGHILLEAADQLPSARGFIIFGTPPLAGARDTQPGEGKKHAPVPDLPPVHPHPASGFMFEPSPSEEQREAFLRALFHPECEKFPDFFREDVQKTDGKARGVLGAAAGRGEFTDEVDIVAQLDTPLAVLHGSEDQLINLRYIRAIEYGSLWHSQIQILSECGHTPQWEQPERFNTLLRQFVEDINER
jgi:pimeloyl-ACP methyl ester carboxylesterase